APSRPPSRPWPAWGPTRRPSRPSWGPRSHRWTPPSSPPGSRRCVGPRADLADRALPATDVRTRATPRPATSRLTTRCRPRPSVEPGREELVLAVLPLLGGDGVADVVLPHAVDLEVALRRALLAQAEFLDHAAAAVVAGHDRHLEAVQAEVLEGEADHHD